jgi:hypothetical protein
MGFFFNCYVIRPSAYTLLSIPPIISTKESETHFGKEPPIPMVYTYWMGAYRRACPHTFCHAVHWPSFNPKLSQFPSSLEEQFFAMVSDVYAGTQIIELVRTI